jgi:hypothetical protein
MKNALLVSIELVGVLSVLSLAYAREAPRPGPGPVTSCALTNTCPPSCPAGFVLSNVIGALPQSLSFTCSMAVTAACPSSGDNTIRIRIGPLQVTGNRVSFDCDYEGPPR